MPPTGHCSAYPQWWDYPNTATATLCIDALNHEHPDMADEALIEDGKGLNTT